MTDRFVRQWQANAEAFAHLIDGRGTPHHREILNPCIEELMGNVRDRRILDAGCGEGYLSRFYAKKGGEVVGVDFSPNLIEFSKETSEEVPIEFRVGNLCDLTEFDAEEFDIVLCNLVLLNLECLEASLQEFHRVLRPNGFLVFSVVHPAFNVYGPGRWELGDRGSRSKRRVGKFFRMDNYFEEKEYKVRWKTRSGQGFPQEFSFFHRAISTYVTLLLQTGFQIAAFKEPRPTSNNPFFDREHRIPFFLVIKAEKT